jgi:glycosyltransferase involved in cell wall biosynthesis
MIHIKEGLLIGITCIFLVCPTLSYAKISRRSFQKRESAQILGIIPQKERLTRIMQEVEENDQVQDESIGAIEDFLIEIFPQEKRIAELIKQTDYAQSEMSAKLSSKINKEEPLLSFVIPCYNRASVIRDTIDSIYAQQLTIPFEVIAIDDASADDSYQILLEYEKSYDNFFVFRNESNKKSAATRNVGIAHARGKYICNADSDDIFEPNTIGPMLRAMIQGRYDLAFFSEVRFFNDIKTNPTISVSQAAPKENKLTFESFLRTMYSVCSSGNRIHTKESWLKSGGYLERPGHDTWTFSYKLFANGYEAYVHPKSAYRHRLWSDQTNVWNQDIKNQTTDVSPLESVLETTELFSPDFTSILGKCKKDVIHFLGGGLNRRSIHFSNQINDLLAAYFHENKREFEAALFYYSHAINQQTHSAYVHLRAIRLALRMRNKDLAISFWNQLSEFI